MSLDEWRILQLLKEGPKNIKTLQQSMWLNIETSRVSMYRALNKLKQKGLLDVIDVGRGRLYMQSGDSHEG